MDFKEIQYVLAIQKYKTLSGAARFLDITQPSLSKFLQNLEKRLTIHLFQRIDNKLIATYAGQQYIDVGLKILDLNHQLQNTLHDIGQNLNGSLSVGVTPTRGRYVLPNVLPEFKRCFPHYKINIIEDGVNSLNQALATGEIDLAIFTGSGGWRGDFQYEQICKEEIVLCISPDNPNAQLIHDREGRKHPWIPITKLMDELFFMVDEKYRTRKIANRILSEAAIHPEIITLQSVETTLSMVATGIGVGFCTDMCEKYFYTQRPLSFCSVGEQDNVWDFVIAHREDSYLSAAGQKFIDITKASFIADTERSMELF